MSSVIQRCCANAEDDLFLFQCGPVIYCHFYSSSGGGGKERKEKKMGSVLKLPIVLRIETLAMRK